MATLTCTCDLCFTRIGRYVEAVYRNIPIKIDDTKGKLDLCEAHFEQLVLPVLEALHDRAEDDAIVNQKKYRRYGPVRCEVPGCTAAPLAHTGTLWNHLQMVHDISMQEYRETYGDPKPLSPDELPDVEVKCEVKGCKQVYSTALGHRWPRGALISHLRGRHGLKADMTPVR